jgi:hypothetical protein
LSRAITSDELVLLRSDKQWSKPKLAIHVPTVVFACQVNQTFDITDGVAECAYNNVTTGAYTDVLAGETAWIGSTPGARDVGIVRVRKAPTSTMFYFGETSDVAWANDLYITVVKQIGLWARVPLDSGSTKFMDYDIPFSATNSFYAPPIPVLGPEVAVLELGEAASVTHQPPSAAASWSPVGATITGFAWVAPGASATSGMTTATPSMTYNAPGWYLIYCTITDSNGQTARGYRWVAVDPDCPPFLITGNPAGSADAGGASFGVKLLDGADPSEIVDGAMVVLWSQDRYDGQAGSLGPIDGYENVITLGRIAGESIKWAPRGSAVEFQVQGPAYWLQQMYSPGFTLNYVSGTPSKWEEYATLTVDKTLAHLVSWRSTIAAVMDVFRSGDTRNAKVLRPASGSLWSQLTGEEMAGKILAEPMCNRYGQLFFEVATQHLDEAARDDVPVVMQLTKNDWRETVDIEARRINQVAMLELSAYKTYDGAALRSVFSRAMGMIARVTGNLEARGPILAADQDDCNRLNGSLLADANNPYPVVPFDLAQNNRFVDIAPQQYVTVDLAAGDTPAGVVWSAQRLVPRRWELVFVKPGNYFRLQLECEAATVVAPGSTYIPPVGTQVTFPPIVITPPLIPPIIPGGGTNFPPVVNPPPPPSDESNCAVDGPNGPYPLIWSVPLLDAQAGPIVAETYFGHFGLRPEEFAYKTTLQVIGTPVGLAWSHLHAYAMDCRGEIAAGGEGTQISDGVFTFAPVIAEAACGFRIVLDNDLDSDFSFGTTGTSLGGGGNIDPTSPAVHFPTGVNNLTPGNIYKAHVFGGNLDNYWAGTISHYTSTETCFDFSNGTSMSGRMGSYGDTDLSNFVDYTVVPVGGLHCVLTTVDDPGDDHKGIDVWFQAVTTKIAVRAFRYPTASAHINYRLEIYVGTVTGERKLYLKGGFLTNICSG